MFVRPVSLPVRRRRFLTPVPLIALALVAAAAAAWAYTRSPVSSNADYITAQVAITTVTQGVSASGTLKPVNTVTVGTQVTGPVLKLHADYNDEVKKGQLLAEIDPTLQQAQIQQTKAQLENAESNMVLAERNTGRLKRLFDAGYVSRTEWENADQAARNARSSYQVTKAQLDRDQQNLEYATVRSPVDGVVISRDVSEGQTVQSNFQAPELFKIAQDLTQMQIEINLSEADVGRVRENQRATFTVDAYPERVFEGTVSKLRLSPNNQNGVVTYVAIVATTNPDRTLFPGMTAYVNVVIDEKKDVLAVPNGALRFVPSSSKTPPSTVGVYVQTPAGPARREVTTGMYDDRNTEITGGDLKEGESVIVREQLLLDDNGAI